MPGLLAAPMHTHLLCGALLMLSLQANAANEFSPEALVPLAGEEWGRAAALLIRLAAAAAAVAGTPLLMAPCR